MRITREVAQTRAAIAAARARGAHVALVPTMGALHAGHLSLISAARRERAGAPPFIAVTIFVNPTQFAPGEDFDRYPRTEAADAALCERAGAHLIFAPETGAMYRPDAVTRISVAGLTEGLCGPWRPGHFDGVATIVAKLFLIAQPDVAYFGEKDAQQLAVIRRMVRDLDFPLEIVGCPTVREPDGLAMSSRNKYLSAAERAQATCLYAALRDARQAITDGERSAARVEDTLARIILSAGPASIDYAHVVDAESLARVQRVERPVLIALAVRIGATRLIDNIRVEPPRA